MKGKASKSSSSSSSSSVDAYLGGRAVGWVPFHPAIAEAFRLYVPKQRAYLAATCALFVAVCWKWSGRSTRCVGDWFDKRNAEMRREIGASERQFRAVCDVVCRRLGLVERVTTGRDNAARYRVVHSQLTAWWLTAGPAPALPLTALGYDTGEPTGYDTGVPTGYDTGVPTGYDTGVPFSIETSGETDIQVDDGDDARARRAVDIRAFLEGWLNVHDHGVLDELSCGLAKLSTDAAVNLIREVSERDSQDAARQRETKYGTPIRSLNGLTISHLRDEIERVG